MNKILLASLILISPLENSYGQSLMTPNGYSGVGLIPTAETLKSGTAVINHTTAIPGAANFSGHNNQIGFGLASNLEFIGRLATQDLHCNMFRSGCPINQIRDVSGSFKAQLPIPWLARNEASVALGIVDVGGAASYFRSDYLVATRRLNQFDISLGYARSKGSYAILGDNFFGGITWSPNEWSKVSIEGIGSAATTHLALTTPPSTSGIKASLTANRRLTNSLKTPQEWFGLSVAIPLSGVDRENPKPQRSSARVVRSIPEQNLSGELERVGFFKPVIGKARDGVATVHIDNTAYQWNVLDAAGVALGLIAGTYGHQEQQFRLTIKTKGLDQLVVSGDAACVRRWFQGGEYCNTLKIESTLSRKTLRTKDQENVSLFRWALRPEITVSPLVVSGVGTEFGALDLDVGLNANANLPLWKGASWEVNRVEPLGFNTRDFERGRPFYSSRIQSAVSRRMFHQVMNFAEINTQVRLSTGLMHTRWRGEQIETQTISDDGRHRLSVTAGTFDDRIRKGLSRDYSLYTYRYAIDSAQRYSSELTYGKFWNGDTGYQVNQRFWYGDTNLNIYVRRTKMSDGNPFVSFAGVQISLPFTPRHTPGARYATVRGINQWTYTLESRILEDANPVGGGYGEVPNAGENLQRIFNRDRSGTEYLQTEVWRLKEAFLTLSE